MLGDHRFDDRLSVRDAETIERLGRETRGFLDRARALDATALGDAGDRLVGERARLRRTRRLVGVAGGGERGGDGEAAHRAREPPAPSRGRGASPAWPAGA